MADWCASEELNSDDQPIGPSPLDFDLYLPWACKQLLVEADIQITKVYQNEYVCVATSDRTQKGKSKAKPVQTMAEDTVQEKEIQCSLGTNIMKSLDISTKPFLNIIAIYDNTGNLVHIKFEKNRFLPRVMMKVIGLIIQFYNYLDTMTINRGLDQYTIYDICKFLPSSQITNLCLDNCCLNQPNYHLLLEKASPLKYLSLSRCNIDDSTVESVFSLLIYPLHASKTLSVLNLSCNMITDEGAKFIAFTLRSNRQLSYLNLASNMITDDGAARILNTLLEFPLTTDEIIAAKTRQVNFLKKKDEAIAETFQCLRLGDAEKKSAKLKSTRIPTVKKLKVDTSQFTDADDKYFSEMDSTKKGKPVNIVENAQGDFVDPFNNTNTHKRNGVTYSKGNNTLCCLNLSFNHLSYLSLRKLQSVLLYQKLLDRKSRGLVSVSVEGNYMPITCKELSQIDAIVGLNLSIQARSPASIRRRSLVKYTSR